MRQRLAILGSTGSIGRQTLDVAAAYPDLFEVRILTAGRNWELLCRQERELIDGKGARRVAGHLWKLAEGSAECQK